MEEVESGQQKVKGAEVEPKVLRMGFNIVRFRTLFLVNFASIIERADEQMLPAAFIFIGRSLNASPSQLGMLTFCRALIQALSSPISGVLGDHHDRSKVLAAGCLIWGLMTFMVGASKSVHESMIWNAFNGLGLSLLIPCAQSLVADLHPANYRGRAFGILGLTGSFGGMLGGFYATNIGHITYKGFEGWRIAFWTVAYVSVLTSFLCYQFVVDPKVNKQLLKGADNGGTITSFFTNLKLHMIQMRKDIGQVWRIPTFQIIVLQGIVGSMPWNALVFFTLWLQLLGFSDLMASKLVAVFFVGTSLGAFLGGCIGDLASRYAPNSGRIITAQVSSFSGLPFSYVLLKMLPVGEDVEQYWWLYVSVMFSMGLLISWCGTGCNGPIFADIVPEELRSTVYAFDRSFEGAVAALGSPLVGFLAEHYFGFQANVADKEGGRDLENAQALSTALLVCLIIPWFFCFVFFGGLYFTYRKDKSYNKRIELQQT